MVLEVKLDAVEDLEKIVREMVAAMVQTAGRPRWYTLKAACEYKGVSYNTVKCSAILQPGCGKADAIINGRKMWNASTVADWCEVTDDNVEDYLRRCRGEK